MQRRPITLSILSVILLVVCCAVSRAQTITGSVNGTVTDPSGAVIPNARVAATNTETGVATETTTNNDGIYNIRFLQIGTYKVTITAQGFATTTYGPFALETGQNAKIDAKLGLENQQQKVSVEAEVAPLLNTENPNPCHHARHPRHREHSVGRSEPDRHHHVSSRLGQHAAQQLR